jgi:uncharacterized membrane protein YphA (DoxX/SURF4 family)
MQQAPETVAWLVLRVVYAWMYLYPALGLVRDWPNTVNTTSLLFKHGTREFALVSVLGMVVGALMILFGVYGQYAAVALVGFNLGGAKIHYLLADMAHQAQLSETASADDRAEFQELATLGWVGHVTSAQKNFVLAAVALFFALVGTGPWSFVPSTGIFGP